MDTAYFRHPNHPGQVTLMTAAQVKKAHMDKIKQTYICPSCGMPAIYVGSHLTPGNKYYRAPHFRHPDQDDCNVSVCDMRAAISPGSSTRLSQKLRTPLFLRPDGNGSFSLSIGFRTENKAILHRLREEGYTTLSVQTNTQELWRVSLEEMEESGEMFFIEIPSAIAAKQNISAFVNGPRKPKSSIEHYGLSSAIDGFSEHANGAIFEYSAGGAGEKVQSGGFITSERPYLLVVKNSGSVYIRPFWEQPRFKSYIQAEYLGKLSLPSSVNTYSVYKVIFPQKRGSISSRTYCDIAEKLQSLCAATLCDSIPEVRPLWPPASRKADAYAVQRMGLTHETVIVDSSDGNTSVQIHKAENDVRDLAVIRQPKACLTTIPLRTTRTSVSCNGGIVSSVSSYRLEEVKEPFAPWLKITGLGSGTITNPGLYKTRYPSSGKITIKSVSEFECYIEGAAPETYDGGVEHIITLTPHKDILIHAAGHLTYVLQFINSNHSSSYARCERYIHYSHYNGYE